MPARPPQITWPRRLVLSLSLLLGGCMLNGQPLLVDLPKVQSARPATAPTTAPRHGGKDQKDDGKDDTATRRGGTARPAPAAAPDQGLRARQRRLGEALAGKILQQKKPVTSGPRLARARAVMDKLRAAEKESGLRWRVHLIRDPRPNAFTTGAGHLFITTSMVDLLPEAGLLATVLAHEMAHNIRLHVIDAWQKKQRAESARKYAREVLSPRLGVWAGKSLAFIVNTTFNVYSRAQENEADKDALVLLVAAGYPPGVVLATFDRMSRIFRDKPAHENFFYGNHPTYRARRWHIRNLIRAHFRKEAGLPPQRDNYRRRKPLPETAR